MAGVEAPLALDLQLVFQAILGSPPDSTCSRRAALPGPLGGIGLRLPGSRSLASYVALSLNAAPRVRSIAISLGRHVSVIPDQHHILQAKSDLGLLGLTVSPGGVVALTEDASALYSAGPWCHDTPVSHLFHASPPHGFTPGYKLASRIQRCLDSLEATKLHSTLDPSGQRTMLSSGGAGTGSFWSHIPLSPDDALDNIHFRMAPLFACGLCSHPIGHYLQHATLGPTYR